jgi:hypothetical protein
LQHADGSDSSHDTVAAESDRNRGPFDVRADYKMRIGLFRSFRGAAISAHGEAALFSCGALPACVDRDDPVVDIRCLGARFGKHGPVATSWAAAHIEIVLR